MTFEVPFDVDATLDAAAWDALARNASRLADEALGALARDIDAATSAGQPPDVTALDPAAEAELLAAAAAASDLDRMDLSMLDGLDLDADVQASPSTGDVSQTSRQADMLAALAALPPALAPLTGALDEAGFAAWLALYRSGHDGLHRVVALMQGAQGLL